MNAWWSDLDTLQKFFYLIAVPSTILLILQTLLSTLGFGDHDGAIDGGIDSPDLDHPLDALSTGGYDQVDSDLSLDPGFRLVTFRGLIAFTTIFGWTGATLAGYDVGAALTVLFAFIAGLIAMSFVALVLYGINKLQSSGNLSYKNAIGVMGTVYLPIPPQRSGRGKVTLTIQERQLQIDAMTDSKEILKTGTLVLVTDLLDNNVLIVEKET